MLGRSVSPVGGMAEWTIAPALKAGGHLL